VNAGPSIVVVCAWCPDAQAQTAAAEKAGHVVSHGCCASCAARVEL